jgi:hypothetical protein
MNWKTNLLLVLLAVGAGAWLWKGDEWAPKLAPKAPPADPEPVLALETDLAPGALTRVEIAPPGAAPFAFEKGPGGWAQAGNWPLRAGAVAELVEALGTLRTRFQPVQLSSEKGLKEFGLDDAQKPLVVKVKANGKEHTLLFGEADSAEPAFARAAFVKLASGEVLKLGADVMPVLRRPADAYRRKQLFAGAERVKLAGAPTAPPGPGAPPGAGAPRTVELPGADVTEIRVSGTVPTALGAPLWFAGSEFTLKRIAPTPAPGTADVKQEPVVQPDRLADAWALEAPVRGPADPEKLRQVLAAVPDLWVEDFWPAPPGATENLGARAVNAFSSGALRVAANVDPRPELERAKQTLTVTTKSGGTVTVKFGGFAKSVEREETTSFPGPMGGPPISSTRTVTTNYRYAQVVGNPQVFTVPADQLNDLFAKAGELLDARVARFDANDVFAVRVAVPGKPPLALTRAAGDPDAKKPEEQRDRWFIDAKPNPLPADPALVSDLLEKLGAFRGDPVADTFAGAPVDAAKGVTITVRAREKRAKGEPEAPARTYEVRVASAGAGKLAVQLAGWPRVARADDTAGPPPQGWLGALFGERLEPLLKRDAVAYRSKQLFDTTGARLTGVTAEGASAFALKREGDDWKLTAPVATVADRPAAEVLSAQLSALRATEFVAEQAAPEHGLEKPKVTATLAFDTGRSYKLEVGAPRPGKKGEAFARLDGGAVFALAFDESDALAAGPLKLLPLQVWTVPLEKLIAVEIARPGAPADSFALAKDATNWKLTGPFTAPVDFLNAQPVTGALCALPAVRYEALAAEPAKYGFDKPFATLKLGYNEKGSDGDRPAVKVLVVGGVAPNGADRFAKLEGGPAVFVVPATYLSALTTSPLALLERNLLNVDPAKIAKVQVAGDKPESVLALAKDDKGAWKAEGAAFAVDAVAVRQLTEAFAPLPIERIAAYGDAVKWADFGLDKPESTVTVALGEKAKSHTVQLGKAAPGGGKFVRVDGGKAVGVVPAFAVAGLSRTKLDFADRTLLAFKPEELLGVTRTKGKDELELAPGAGDGWDVVKPAKQKADKPLMEELADALGRLRAQKVVAFGKKADVFKAHGLDAPEAKLALTVGEKAEQKVLLFGKPVDAAKPDGDRYVAVETGAPDAAVGVLPAVLANKLLAPAVSFRDRTLVKFVDADKLVLERDARKVTFGKVNGSWKVTAPLAADAEQAALDELVNEFARLRAADWVSEKPTAAELKAFGLEKPEATWTVSDGEKVVLALRIGKRAADGRAYAQASATGPVALLGAPQSAKVLAEYRTRKPWALDGFQAEEVLVAVGDKSFALKKAGATWSDPAAPADAVFQPAVTELLGALTALQVDRYAVDEDGDPKLFGLDKPAAQITVTFKDGSKRVLAVGGAVGGTDGKQRYARVVDPARTEVFVLSAADSARFTRDRAVFVPKK